jgi:hypothetical protein
MNLFFKNFLIILESNKKVEEQNSSNFRNLKANKDNTVKQRFFQYFLTLKCFGCGQEIQKIHNFSDLTERH